MSESCSAGELLQVPSSKDTLTRATAINVICHLGLRWSDSRSSAIEIHAPLQTDVDMAVFSTRKPANCAVCVCARSKLRRGCSNALRCKLQFAGGTQFVEQQLAPEVCGAAQVAPPANTICIAKVCCSCAKRAAADAAANAHKLKLHCNAVARGLHAQGRARNCTLAKLHCNAAAAAVVDQKCRASKICEIL